MNNYYNTYINNINEYSKLSICQKFYISEIPLTHTSTNSILFLNL